jgi:multidrug resistance protein, MATE family
MRIPNAAESPSDGERQVDAADPGRRFGLVWAVSVPILLFEVGQAVIHATDTALLARVGLAELGAIALADIIRGVWIVPVAALTEAAQIVMARRVGEGRRPAVGGTFTRSLVLVLGFGMVLAVALSASAGAIASFTATSPGVEEALTQYLRVAAWGLPFQALALACSSVYVAIGRTRALVGATIVLTLVNLLMSWMLIFGRFGLPSLGMAGAAWGYLFAQACMLAWLMVNLRRRALASYGIFRLHAPFAASVQTLVRLSAPVSGQGLLEYGRWFVFFLILERAGEEVLAWSNLVYACVTLLVIPTFAFAETAYTLVSRVIGSGRPEQIRQVVRRTVAPALMLTLPFVVAILIAPELVLRIFTDDPLALEGAAPALRTVALAFFIVVPAEIWAAALFGTGDTDAALAIEVITGAAMLVAAWLAALVFGLPLAWIWASLALASATSMPLAWGWVRSGRWRSKVI